MELFIIIVLIVLGVIAFSGAGKKKSTKSINQIPQRRIPTAPHDPARKYPQPTLPKTDNEKRALDLEELQKTQVRGIKITVGMSSLQLNDDSVIDISESGYNIPKSAVEGGNEVPNWPHFYVYSYHDLYNANREQRAFYEHFRDCFLNGQCLDIKGNTNYAFILLFDLLQNSDSQPDLKALEDQLWVLGENYSRTASYCRSFLIEKMRKRGDYDGAVRINEKYGIRNTTTVTDYADYNLGSKYKTKLKLTEEQVRLVNKIYFPNNNFCSIEFCLLQTIRLYLFLAKEFDHLFEKENSSLSKELESIASIIAVKQYKYRQNSSNFKYAVESFSAELYRLLFKHCENALRDYYGHKRKLNTDFQFGFEAGKQLQTKIIDRISEVLNTVLPKIELPNEAAELALNEQNTSRWKTAFEIIKVESGGDSKAFSKAIHQLAAVNKRNLSIENIFLEASKWIAKCDREASVTLYVHYLYYDLKSATFDNKPLTKTIQKSLFKTQEELQAFEQLITSFIKDRDLEKALQAVSRIFGPRRKKIKLDASAITEVHQKHSSTVDMLEVLLNDKDEEEPADSQAQVDKEVIQIEIIKELDTSTKQPQVNNSLNLLPAHLELLEVFEKQNMVVSQEEMEAFAKSKNLFKNGLVESLNEACYEYLDDVLIEEEDDNFIINDQYFQRIKAV